MPLKQNDETIASPAPAPAYQESEGLSLPKQETVSSLNNSPQKLAQEVRQQSETHLKNERDLLVDTIKQGIKQLTLTGNQERNIKTVKEQFDNRRIADYKDYLDHQSSAYLD